MVVIVLMRWGTAVSVAMPAVALAGGASGPPTASKAWTHWSCDVAYMPQRSTWLRQVALQRGEGNRPKAVHIDGVPVYTFTWQDGVVWTSLDNERIQIDLQAATWRSDFRGLATGAGRCEQEAAASPVR